MENYVLHVEPDGSQFWTFSVVGVSQVNEDGSRRQDVLERYSIAREATTSAVEYDRDGKPGYHIELNGQGIGDVPGNIAIKFSELDAAGYLWMITYVSFHGGPTETNPDRPYGAEITVKFTDPNRPVVAKPIRVENVAPDIGQTPATAAEQIQPQKQDHVANGLKRIQRLAILIAVVAFFGTALYSLLSKLWWAFWLR